MAPPSKLAIATSSVSRLLKEEASYHEEEKQQEARIQNSEQTSSGENAEFQLRQERKALEETKAMFPSLRKRISEAVSQLEQRLAADGPSAPEEDVAKANEALSRATSGRS